MHIGEKKGPQIIQKQHSQSKLETNRAQSMKFEKKY